MQQINTYLARDWHHARPHVPSGDIHRSPAGLRPDEDIMISDGANGTDSAHGDGLFP
jgi:hypothetical protein